MSNSLGQNRMFSFSGISHSYSSASLCVNMIQLNPWISEFEVRSGRLHRDTNQHGPPLHGGQRSCQEFPGGASGRRMLDIGSNTIWLSNLWLGVAYIADTNITIESNDTRTNITTSSEVHTSTHRPSMYAIEKTAIKA